MRFMTISLFLLKETPTSYPQLFNYAWNSLSEETVNSPNLHSFINLLSVR